MKTTCSVDSCDKPARQCGWCHGHYYRYYRTGDVRADFPLGKKNHSPIQCNVDSCNRQAAARGLCETHYCRWKRTGEPGTVEIRDHKKTFPSYQGAHYQVLHAKGPASTHLCGCGDQAAEWAYQHNNPNPLYDTQGRNQGLLFSDDINCYEPMCRHCHKTLDMQRTRPLSKR